VVEVDAVAAARVAAVPQVQVQVQVPRVRALLALALPVQARTRRLAEVLDVVPRRQQALNHHRFRQLRPQTMGAGSIAARTTA